MQRFDSVIVRRTLSTAKPSNSDCHLPTKSPPITTTSPLEPKSSTDDSPETGWPPPFTTSSFSHRPLHTSTSINSIKPSYDQATNVNKNNTNDPENLLSQTRLQTMLSRFRQDLELTPYRLDLKRSSV
jgi:hypothetical protein